MTNVKSLYSKITKDAKKLVAEYDAIPAITPQQKEERRISKLMRKRAREDYKTLRK